MADEGGGGDNVNNNNMGNHLQLLPGNRQQQRHVSRCQQGTVRVLLTDSPNKGHSSGFKAALVHL